TLADLTDATFERFLVSHLRGRSLGSVSKARDHLHALWCFAVRTGQLSHWPTGARWRHDLPSNPDAERQGVAHSVPTIAMDDRPKWRGKPKKRFRRRSLAGHFVRRFKPERLAKRSKWTVHQYRI